MVQGFFVVLEGGDYTGKKVQSLKLAEHILDLSEDNDILITHEPTRHAREIKRKLKEDDDAYSDSRKMAELYVDDRRNHVKNIIGPFLDQGGIVIGNRYSMSTCVYQSLSGVSLPELIKMHEGVIVPDLTILLDINPLTADERSAGREEEPEKKFEANIEFRNKVYEKYLELANSDEYQNNMGKIKVVDGNGSVNSVTEQIKGAFDSIS